MPVPGTKGFLLTAAYAELHCHSAYSFLDGASRPEELAARAHELGHSALALTDHDNLCGALEFAHAAKALGLRPITGCELTVGDEHGIFHVTLLVETRTGYAHLSQLLSAAHAHDRLVPRTPLAALCAGAEGLVCLTGCARHGALVHPDEQVALVRGRALRQAFGAGGLRVELQRPLWRGDRARNRRLIECAATLGVRLCASNDVHMHERRRGALQDALVAIRTHLPLEACEAERRGNREHVLKSPAELALLFADLPEAIGETVALADRLRFDITQDLGYRYPAADDTVADAELAQICALELERRYRGLSYRDEARTRLDEELALIRFHGLSGFFLLHREILEIAREIAIAVRGPHSARMALPPGRGRGSSVGSIVCYLTGLSHVDPVTARLSLGRFLNRELTSVPDIDLDFPRDIRERLILAVHDRFGRERSALIAAFSTYRSRSAIRELGKALGLPPPDLERLARGSDGWHADRVGEELAQMSGIRERSHDRRFRALAHLCGEIAGLPRHLSQHPGGMIVSTGPLAELVPLVPAAMEGRQICQWDKDSCADAGFLKIDLLGLGMLSAVEGCVDLIARARGETVDLSRVPLDDPGTYAEIQAADTVGVFQIESRAQMQMLLRTRPENLEDLTVEVALVRPGPIQGGAVHPYLERREAVRNDPDSTVPYDHPLLAEALADTLGVIVYQDQVLDVAVALAGFSQGQAESLRRAMSRRRSREAMVAHWHSFRDGALARGVPEPIARQVFEKIVAFSEFGFPKAHAAAFGLLAYQSAWLRRRYPAEFLCALLNEQPMGFYPPASLIRDAQRRGVEVAGADVNDSHALCSIEPGGAVRIGLSYVRGLGRPAALGLVAAREDGGPYADVADLVRRAGLSLPECERVIAAGACDAFGPRREQLWRAGLIARPESTRGGGRQLALDLEIGATPVLPRAGAWDELVADYETTGISVRDHPLAQLRGGLTARGFVATAALEQLPSGTPIRIAGLTVARQRPASAKGVVFLLLEDEHGLVNLVLFRDVYEQHRLLARTEPLLEAYGTLERRERNINVIVERLLPLGTPSRRVLPTTGLQPVGSAQIFEELPMAAGDDVTRLRATAPGAHHFGSGRGKR
ncbi:MAG: error-prone polymerase [Gaiellales bacterium]|nr:error-prone polymerase [Gaiellales bacterium]